jgi:type I restriction enzyme S subunit
MKLQDRYSEKLIPNPDWAELPLFDRKGWKRVRFGDVVENINETCDPEESGLERFIGLEHLEPGSLHIRKWGDVSDGTTFTRQCRPGQVLFGKRRAYQRKVAVAEFDAVVSGDIYVLAPKNDKLLSQLLPFICLSERFFQHAVGTSAGSLSPRTNWSSLATFEFDLPTLDQQRRIAEILWAVDEYIDNLRTAKRQHEQTQIAQLSAIMLGLMNNMACRLQDIGDFVPPLGWKVKRAEEIVSAPITKGTTPTRLMNTERAFVPFLKVYNLTFTGDLDFTIDPTYVEPEVHNMELKRSKVFPGDILMNIVGPPLGKTALIPKDFPEANVNQAIAIYRIEDPETREFFAEYLRADLAQKWLARQSKKTSGQQNLTLHIVQQLPVPIPPKEVLCTYVQTARKYASVRGAIEKALRDTLALSAAILNEIQ